VVFCRADTVLAATNKCLAQNNKSRMGGKATKKRTIEIAKNVVILGLE
jgi:hypothetical protein